MAASNKSKNPAAFTEEFSPAQRNARFSFAWGAATGIMLFAPFAAGLAMGGVVAGAAIVGGAAVGAVVGMFAAPAPGAPMMIPGAVAGAVAGGALVLGLVPGAIAAVAGLASGELLSKALLGRTNKNLTPGKRPVLSAPQAILGASLALTVSCGLGAFGHSLKEEANRNFAAVQQTKVVPGARIAPAPVAPARAASPAV